MNGNITTGNFRERGQAALYVLVSLPLALTFSVAVVDISATLAARDELQREADRIALTATKLLPNTEAARSYIENSVTALSPIILARNDIDDRGIPTGGIKDLSAQLNSRPFLVHDSVVKLTLRAAHKVLFDHFLGTQLNFTIEKSSVAQIIPSDTVLILDDGSSLRPALGSSWGDPVEWPATGYFNCVTHPALPSFGEPSAILGRYNDPAFQRSATQACFSPIFYQLKLAAIGVADSMGSFSLNRVAAIVAPGNATIGAGKFLRRLRGSSTEDGGFATSAVANSEVTTEALDYTESANLLGDEACALFSLYDGYGTGRYRLPDVQAPYQLQHSPRDGDSPVTTTPCGSFHFPYGHFSPEYLATDLSLRETIFWQSTKVLTDGGPLVADVPGTLRRAIAELLITDNPAAIQFETAVRGNSAFRPLRQIVFFTNAVPTISPDLIQVVGLLRSLQKQGTPVFVTFVALTPSETNGDSSHALDPSGEILRVFATTSATHLFEQVLPQIVQRGYGTRIRT